MKGSERPVAARAIPDPIEVELASTPTGWTRVTQLAVIAIALILVGAALREIGSIAIPVVGAIITGLTLGPIADRLGRLGVPAFIMAFGLVAALALFLAVAFVLLSAPLASWIDRAPEIGRMLQERLLFLIEPLKSAERIQDMVKGAFGGTDSALAVEVAEPSLGRSLLETLSPAVGQVLIFLGSLFFLLVSRERMRKTVVLAFNTRERRLTALKVITGIQQDLGHFFGTITLINIALGVLVALVLLAVGMSSSPLWGVLAFAFNFVPYVGPIVMASLLIVGGLFTFETFGWGIMPALLYILIHSTESQFVTPALLGRRFDINPLIVFLSIVLGTWLWGAIGAFLAAPLLVIVTSAWARIAEQDRSFLPE